MSFAGELKGFVRGFNAGSVILARNAERKRIEMNLPLFGPEDYRAGRVPASALETSGGGTGGAVGTTTAPSESGSQFAQSAYAHYRQKGLSHAAAAGIVGNLMQESGGAADVLNGQRFGDNNTSGFAAQWRDDKPGGGTGPGQRLSNLRAFAKARGHDIPTVPDQLDFVLEEMNPNSPYVDSQAAKMFPALQGAASVEQAVRLFADNFERPAAAHANMPNRIKQASVFSDTGGGGTQFAFDTTTAQPTAQPGTHVATTAQTDPTQTGGIPEEDVEDEEEQPLAESPTITTPEVDLSPQVQETPQVDEDEDERRYAMGGAIPDDTQYFQTAGTVDPYNPNRGYTQMAGAGYKPPAQARRITLPSHGQTGTGTNAAGQNWRDWGAAGTPGQQKLRNFRAEQAAAAKAKADAEAAAAAAAAKQQQQPTMRNQYNQLSGQELMMMKFGKMPENFDQKAARNDQLLRVFAGGMGRQNWGARAKGGMVYENFARGGTVAKKPARPQRQARYDNVDVDKIDWAERNRRAGKPSFEDTVAKYQRTTGDRAESAGQGARDRAAREMNARAGGPPSTAWREPYLRPTAAPAPQQVRPAPPVRPTPTRPMAPVGPPPVTGGEDEGGPMPQVNPMGDVVAPEAGRPYPEGFDTPGEVEDAMRSDPNWKGRRPPPPQIDVPEAPPVDPNTGEPLETQPAMAGGGYIGFARGGAIPDDDRPRSERAESAGYQRPRRKAKKDPWAGMRTKTSEKVRKPSTKSVKRGAAKRKKKGVSQPGRERRKQTLPEKGPIPPDRLPETAPTPTNRPTRSAAVPPGTAPPVRDPGGLMQPIGTLGPAKEPFRPAETQGASPFPPPNASVPMPPRPQQGPPAPRYGQPLSQESPGMQTFQGRPQQGPPMPPPREVDPNSGWLARDEEYKRRIMEDMRVRGGPGSPPPATRSVTPARSESEEPPYYDVSQLPTDRFGNPITEEYPEGPMAADVVTPEEYLGYARGGVIPDDTDGPFRQRAGGRSGLQLRRRRR